MTRNGDFDWIIAKKQGISLSQLHRLNPYVNWDALPIGAHLNIGGGRATSKVAHVSTKHHISAGRYVVRAGDNDWILAHRAGITVHELKQLNPDVRWDRIQPGQAIRLPGGSDRVASHSRLHSRFAKVSADAVKIHRSPGTRADVITTVDAGIRARVLDRDGDWIRLRFPKGTEGWVRADLLVASKSDGERHSPHRRRHSYVTYRHRHHHANGEWISPDSEVAMNNPIIHKATTFNHVPYVWGGSSRSGTDCSGFVSQVYHSQGVHLPRTSREQATVGKKVGRNELRAGDLVFFHTMRGSRVSHVGIYVGNGKFIHASSGGGQVQVNKLTEGYYAHRFVTARRVHTASEHSKSK